MDILLLISWAAASLGMATSLPQLIRIFRTQITAGVSTRLWQLGALSSAGWTAHGLFLGVPALALPSFVVLIMQLCVIWLICRNESKAFGGALGLPVVGALSMIAMEIVGGSAAFGAVAIVVPVMGQISQLLVMRRAADLQGVSLAYLLLNFGSQLLWSVWGFATAEPATLMTSVAVMAALTGSISYYLYRRHMLALVSEPVVIRVAA